MELTEEKMAGMIDHTLLKSDSSSLAIEKLCEEAQKFKFAAVCVNPCRVQLAESLLSGTNVRVASVAGFPLGASKTETKVYEAQTAIREGASEIDMVANIGFLKERDLEKYRKEIEAVVGLGATTKIIIEACYLTPDEMGLASRLCVEAGAHFVKTSTGFGPSGAKAQDIRLMRSIIGNKAKIKAAGGIRDFTTALEMIRAGADRIGTSAGVAIMEGFYRTEV